LTAVVVIAKGWCWAGTAIPVAPLLLLPLMVVLLNVSELLVFGPLVSPSPIAALVLLVLLVDSIYGSAL
jgi:hypothetical protein